MVSFLHVLLPLLCFIGSNSYRLVPKSTLEPTTFQPYEFISCENVTPIDQVYPMVNDSVDGPYGYEMVTYFMTGKKQEAYWVINLSRYPTRKLMCGGFQMTNITTNFTVYFNWEIIDEPLPGNEYPPKARNLTWKTNPPNTKIYHPKWRLYSDTFRQPVKFKARRNGEWYFFFGSTVIKGGTENHTVIVEDLTKKHEVIGVWNFHPINKRSLDNEYKEMMKANKNNSYEESTKKDNETDKYEESTKKDNENKTSIREKIFSKIDKINFIRNLLKHFDKEKYRKKYVKVKRWVKNIFDDWLKRPLKAATKRVVGHAVHTGIQRLYEWVQSEGPNWVRYIFTTPRSEWAHMRYPQNYYGGSYSSFASPDSSSSDKQSSKDNSRSSQKWRSKVYSPRYSQKRQSEDYSDSSN